MAVILTRLSILLALTIVSLPAATANQSKPQVHLRGVVLPAQKVMFSFAQQGIVRQIASGGSLLKKGDIIAKLNDAKLQAQLSKSQAEWRAAESELAAAIHDRDKSARLITEDILSDLALTESEFSVTTAQERVNAAKAQISIAQADLAASVIKAPFDGVVIQANVGTGEWAKQGEPYIEFVNYQKLKLSLDLPPHMVQSLTLGLTTTVFDKQQQYGQATVKTIYPVIDPASGLQRVIWTVDAKQGLLLSGRYVSLAPWPQLTLQPTQHAE